MDRRRRLQRISYRSSFQLIVLLLLLSASIWFSTLDPFLPDPYLDEVFHVRQAQAYWAHRWREWDPKITTPPGLYLLSYLLLIVPGVIVLAFGGASVKIHVYFLRLTNQIAFTFLFPFRVQKLLALIWSRSDQNKQQKGRSENEVQDRNIDHAVLNICLFPPLFFFTALYYTDPWAVLTVLGTYVADLQSDYDNNHSEEPKTLAEWPRHVMEKVLRKRSVYLFGLFSLLFRQTNIFWVAVFLGGLQVLRSVKEASTEFQPSRIPDIAIGSWRENKFYDLLVSDASIEDYFKTTMSVAISAISHWRRVLPNLAPYISFLAIFGAFILWNGGVVLGHKEYHTAGLHLPQMLYIWPNFMFFSWPTIYPYILNNCVPQASVPKSFRHGSLWDRLPRPFVAIMITGIMLVIVHFNTIIHPFTLADNRHYVFYVFRILLRHPLIKYLAVPVYFVCGWAAIAALGGMPQTPHQSPETVPREKRAKTEESESRKVSKRAEQDGGVRVSFVLVWLASTALSLIMAPLVEPRYFIIPWIMWRLHVPSLPASSAPASSVAPRGLTRGQKIRNSLRDHDHRLWIETVWLLIINWVTGYVFLHKGFEWPQEPGKVQRFMW